MGGVNNRAYNRIAMADLSDDAKVKLSNDFLQSKSLKILCVDRDGTPLLNSFKDGFASLM